MEEKIFISYSKKDREIAHEICYGLEKRGIDCWIAPRDIEVGESWADQIVKSIENCRGYLVLISPISQTSDEVLKEITLASELKKKIYAVCVDGCEPVGGYKYHLSIAQRMDYVKGDNALLDKLSNEIQGRQSRRQGPVDIPEDTGGEKKDCLEIVTYKELVKRGITKSEIARQLVANDRELYPDIDDANEGDVLQWENYLSSYPQTFRYMVNQENRIIGNWSMVAVSAQDYRKAKTGQLVEQDLVINNTEYFMFGGVFYGYLLNMSINKEYMSPMNLRRLFDSFLEQLEEFAEEDIYFRGWCVNVFLPEHEHRYKGLGFHYVCDNVKSGKIYALDFCPYPSNKIFQKRKRLKQLYERKFHFECRQLKDTDYVEEHTLEEIAGLIYDTDPYIYPAMFGTREQAVELIPSLIRSKDAMFRLDNLFILEYEDQVAGLILWKKGKLQWSKEKFIHISNYLEVPISPYLNQVTERYVETYAQVEDEEMISIINCCVAEEFRGLGVGKELMAAFLKRNPGEKMELCVLEENPGAVKLYQNFGFRETARYQGFSVDERELVCIGMQK